MPATADDRTALSVSELAETLRGLLEDTLPGIWVQGELSNFRNHPSGHWYFTLKDAGAQVRCVMFRGKNFRIRPVPADGDAVLLRGTVSFYPVSGSLQVIAEYLEPAGEGALLRAFEALKKKLSAEGLFEEAIKRPLPEFPRGIGVITSAAGAALHDILTTLRRRYAPGSAWVYPVPVQGDAAPPAIARALERLPSVAPVDVIVLARGGGSLEDLWAFNDERVARAIRACGVPVVTGVGHETDFTIADLAADLRAPTPTGAAERVTPDASKWPGLLEEMAITLAGRQRDILLDASQAVTRLRDRLDRVHPGRMLEQFAQRLDGLDDRLRHAGPALLARRRERLAARETLLNSLGPKAVMQRGYAIVRDGSGAVVRDSAQLSPGEVIETAFAKGSAVSEVRKVR